MNVIITESQEKEIMQYILEYLEETLVPLDGWYSTEDYLKDIKLNGGETFFPFQFDNGDEPLWYSECDNENLQFDLDPEICPLVLVPSRIENMLNSYFGNIWMPVFKRWFKNKTGLPVKIVDIE